MGILGLLVPDFFKESDTRGAVTGRQTQGVMYMYFCLHVC